MEDRSLASSGCGVLWEKSTNRHYSPFALACQEQYVYSASPCCSCYLDYHKSHFTLEVLFCQIPLYLLMESVNFYLINLSVRCGAIRTARCGKVRAFIS